VTDICIISCGAKKVWSHQRRPVMVAAKDAYIGPLFKKSKEFAEKFFPFHWFILSDKYGLIHPQTAIQDYNISPDQIRNDPGFIALVTGQKNTLNLSPSTIYTTSGKLHESIIRTVFPETIIVNPVSGLSQGMRMQRLNHILTGGKGR
jgi:hypothetical protein